MFFLFILGALLIYFIYLYNQFIKVHNKIEEALSDIDVALSRRYATLTNLVEVVKGYAKHEASVFTSIAQIRQNPSMQERQDVDIRQMKTAVQLIALKESYPELKANEQFLSLQHAIFDLEEHLAASRRMYNSNVSMYNDLVLSFPSNLIANMIHAEKEEYFEADAEEKNNILIHMK